MQIPVVSKPDDTFGVIQAEGPMTGPRASPNAWHRSGATASPAPPHPDWGRARSSRPEPALPRTDHRRRRRSRDLVEVPGTAASGGPGRRGGRHSWRPLRRLRDQPPASPRRHTAVPAPRTRPDIGAFLHEGFGGSGSRMAKHRQTGAHHHGDPAPTPGWPVSQRPTGGRRKARTFNTLYLSSRGVTWADRRRPPLPTSSQCASARERVTATAPTALTRPVDFALTVNHWLIGGLWIGFGRLLNLAPITPLTCWNGW